MIVIKSTGAIIDQRAVAQINIIYQKVNSMRQTAWWKDSVAVMKKKIIHTQNKSVTRLSLGKNLFWEAKTVDLMRDYRAQNKMESSVFFYLEFLS